MDHNSYNILKEYYERAYLSHLQLSPPEILLTTLILDVLNMIGGSKGAIIRPDNHSTIVQARQSKSVRGDSILSSNTTKNTTNDKQSTNYDSSNNDSSNNDSSKDTQSINVPLRTKEDWFDNDKNSAYYKALNQKKTITENGVLSIPFLFCSEINGVMVVEFDSTSIATHGGSTIIDTDIFEPFRNLMGSLMYSVYDNDTVYDGPQEYAHFSHHEQGIRKRKSLPELRRKKADRKCRTCVSGASSASGKYNTISDTRKTNSICPNRIEMSRTYQIMIDAVNTVCNAIVITDRNMRIVFTNDSADRLLENANNENGESAHIEKANRPSIVNIIDAVPQTVTLLSGTNDKFYKNKKIIGELKTDKVEIIANSMCSNGSMYHVLKIERVGRASTCDKTSKRKNLVAYLSHELRNPIQTVTTGVYVMNKTLQSICKSNNFPSIFSSFGSTDSLDSLDNLDRPEKRHSMSSIESQDSEYSQDASTDDLEESTELVRRRSVLQLSASSDALETLVEIGERAPTLSKTNMQTLRSIMKRIDNSCKNMNIIIGDILDLSKLDNDEMIMNMDDYEIEDIVQMISDEYTDVARLKNLSLICTIDADVPETIYTDDTRIYQILANLVSNSIKYSNTGSIKVAVHYCDDSNSVCFEVADKGKGIRKSEINNLFKDYGGTSNCTPEVESNGLGLSVCQKLANLLGGTIEVRSEYKKGSTFIFRHPIELSHSKCEVPMTESEVWQNLAIQDIKGDVLIVDDDRNITSLFKLLLKWINYDYGTELKIDIAKSEERVLRLTSQKKYSLIFMDIDLDDDDGCNVCSAVRNTINKETPIVAVTADIKSVQKDRDSRYNCFQEILLKPFTNRDIERVISKHMA